VTLARVLAPWLPRMGALEGGDGPVVVGCSGGADSLALLALATAAGNDVVAVYVDHGLRDGTEFEYGVVRAAAAMLGVRAHVESVHVEPGPNLEARARAARYAALEATRRLYGAERVLVAHTRDDQAETVLLQFLRGSGTAGLSGMPSVRDHVRRPLLTFRRSETRQICARLGLAPVEDPMNRDIRHRRVWLRREVMPRLEQGAQRDLVDVIARQADVLRDEDALLDSLAAEAIAVDGPVLTVDQVVRAPLPLARRAVRRWLGSPPLSLAHVESVLDVVRGNRRALELPGGRRVERVRGTVHLVAVAPERPEAVTLTLPGRSRFGPWAVEAWTEEGAPVAWPNGRTTAVFDADRAGDSVAVRGPVPGERFRPAGGTGSKLVHDALAEAGVPASARADRPVLADSSGAVMWVVGYRIDDRVRVTSRTRRYLWVTSEVGEE
jgi:tRNA(Ile)-lysidine synthase